MARNTYGLDLGSYEIKVYDKKQDTIWKEKDVIAIRDKKEIFAAAFALADEPVFCGNTGEGRADRRL